MNARANHPHHFLISFALLLFCIISSFSSKAQNCNCTVDQVQSNSVSPCTIVKGSIDTVASAAEIRTAINQANASGGNRTILIEDGTYLIASTSSYPYITASNVVIRSLSGNRDAVILTGGGMTPDSETENGFLVGGDSVVIADLTIKDVGNHGIQVSGHHLYVHNVHIEDTYEQMIKGATSAASIDSAIVQCSLFDYSAEVGPNWYIGGLDIHKGKSWIVRDNVFKYISSPAARLAEHAVHFWDNSSDNAVERNMIFNCDRGVGFGLGQSGNQNDGGIIRNNMIYNDGTALFDDVGIGLETSPNTKVYNNTIYIDYFNAIEYRFSGTTGVDIKNNLTNKAISSRNDGAGTIESNVTNAASSWFADLSTGNLHLASPIATVVDEGTALLEVSDDIDKTARPLALGHDIGAHEFWAGATSDVNLDFSLIAYPNPCISETTIQLGNGYNEAALCATLIDALGKEVKQFHQMKSADMELDVNDIENGMYFLLLSDNENTVAFIKLVIQK